MNTKQSCVFTEWDKRRVDRIGSVIQFFVLRKPKAERIRSRQNDFHALHGVNIREQSSGIYKILHQRDFVNEYVLISAR